MSYESGLEPPSRVDLSVFVGTDIFVVYIFPTWEMVTE